MPKIQKNSEPAANAPDTENVDAALHDTAAQGALQDEPQANDSAAVQGETSLQEELDALKRILAEQEDKYLRLAAEYDNYRKRSQREKNSTWVEAQSETALAFLPVYDNLERALKHETSDKAYAKGVEMTMTQLKSVLEKLGIEEIPAVGHPFDPLFHNAVMHIVDENLDQNIVVESFQTGFKLADKVIRVAMVKVAN